MKTAPQDALWLGAAKLWFALAAYSLYAGLAHLLTPADFGVYGLVSNLISIFNIVVVTGTIQSVASFVTRGDGEQVKRQALKVLGVTGGLLAGGFFLASAGLAWAFRDLSLTPYFQLTSALIFFYSLYAVFIGFLNGKKEFRSQGIFDICYSTLRVGLILIFAYFSSSVWGALSGFVLASCVIVLVAAALLGIGRSGQAFRVQEFLKFGSFVLGFYLLANLMMNTDLFLIKALGPQAEAGEMTGFYTGSLAIARVPYMVLQALSLAVFPLVSEAHAVEHHEKRARTIEKSLSLCFLLALLPAVLIAADPAATLTLIFPAAYSVGGDALAVLAFGYVFFALFILSGTVLNGIGKAPVAFGAALGALFFEVTLAAWLIPRFGLLGAAAAAAAAYGACFGFNAVYLLKRRIFVFPWLTFFKISSVGIVLCLFSRLFPQTGFLLLLKDVLLGLLGLAALWMLRVFTQDDLNAFFGKKKK